MTGYIQEYYKSVCEAYRLGNIETSYNAPIIALLTKFGCNARDLSGERSRKAGENIDIKLWRGDVDVTETEPFAGVEVKKVNGIDARAKAQIKKEAALYGHAILTDNLELYGLFSRIKTDLRPLLQSRSFADMYAQTIVYGNHYQRCHPRHHRHIYM